MPKFNHFERAAIILAAIIIGCVFSLIFQTSVVVACVVGALCMMFIWEGKSLN